MRTVVLALPVLMMLSGCGLVGMVASGVSDGTKYVINRVERDPEIQARAQQGYGPAQGEGVAATTPTEIYPNQSYPNQGYQPQQYPMEQNGGATGAPAPLTARVQPVTRGEPLN
jgi:uncharacterized protein YceK